MFRLTEERSYLNYCQKISHFCISFTVQYVEFSVRRLANSFHLLVEKVVILSCPYRLQSILNVLSLFYNCLYFAILDILATFKFVLCQKPGDSGAPKTRILTITMNIL